MCTRSLSGGGGWNVSPDFKMTPLRGHASYVTDCLLESPLLWSCDADGCLHSWDTTAGAALQQRKVADCAVLRMMVWPGAPPAADQEEEFQESSEGLEGSSSSHSPPADDLLLLLLENGHLLGFPHHGAGLPFLC